jgi:hypothetical protein
MGARRGLRGGNGGTPRSGSVAGTDHDRLPGGQGWRVFARTAEPTLRGRIRHTFWGCRTASEPTCWLVHKSRCQCCSVGRGHSRRGARSLIQEATKRYPPALRRLGAPNRSCGDRGWPTKGRSPRPAAPTSSSSRPSRIHNPDYPPRFVSGTRPSRSERPHEPSGLLIRRLHRRPGQRPRLPLRRSAVG